MSQWLLVGFIADGHFPPFRRCTMMHLVFQTSVSDQPRYKKRLSFRTCEPSLFVLSLGGWERKSEGSPDRLQVPGPMAQRRERSRASDLSCDAPRTQAPGSAPSQPWPLLPDVSAQSCFGRRSFLSSGLSSQEPSQPWSWALAHQSPRTGPCARVCGDHAFCTLGLPCAGGHRLGDLSVCDHPKRRR